MRDRSQRLKLGLGAALAAAVLAGTGAVAAGRLFGAPAALNPCAAKTLNPCGAKTLNPCGAKTLNPCAAKTLNPCAAKTLNPCGAKTLNPCAAKTLNPCAAKTLNPCGAKTLNPCVAKTLNPCAAKTLNPCAAKTLNPCAAKGANPCGGAAVDPAKFVRPAGATLATGSSADLVARGEKLWNDRSLGNSGLACSSCHVDRYTLMNTSFASPYPHRVAMPEQQAGVSEVDAAEMVQFCMIVPMLAEPFEWSSPDLASLTAYVESIQPGYHPIGAPGANPCGG